jgi:site-specific recombinase XerD
MVASTLTLADAARMMRDARDNGYQATPLGPHVDRYLRWKRSEWGAAASTLRAIKYVLYPLAVDHADLELRDFEPPVGTERLRKFWDYHYGHLSARTRANRLSILSDFFKWACRERLLYGDPTLPIRRPKVHHAPVELFPKSLVHRVISAQTYVADEIGCRLILIYALRNAEVASRQFKHFDFDRRLLSIVGKGSKARQVPIIDDAFWVQLGRLELELQAQPDDYLLYRTDTKRVVCPLDEAEEVLALGRGVQRGYRRRIIRDHSRPISSSSMHRWWYACLQRAGEVPANVTAGMNMHRGRHTAITDLLRTPGVNLKHAQLLAGHASIQTTADEYAGFDTGDVAHAYQLKADWDAKD